MFEYDIETISRILQIEGFELDKLDLNLIQRVSMHQYRTSSFEKPLLLIENLQVCIGLFAYSKNFAFAAHINPVVIRGDEFKCDENKNIISCNRINDLYNSIIATKVEEPVYIGISVGFNPVFKTYQQVNKIREDIDMLIKKLNENGINATKLDVQNNHIFILDSINGKILTPMMVNDKPIVKIK